MSLTDPIADMLTRIRNAVRISGRQVNIKCTKVCMAIASVLKSEGYINDFDRGETPPQAVLRVTLKYDQTGRSAIEQIERISKPGRRVYSSVDDLPLVMNGMGIAIVSTPRGIMTDAEAREQNLGGELICTVW